MVLLYKCCNDDDSNFYNNDYDNDVDGSCFVCCDVVGDDNLDDNNNNDDGYKDIMIMFFPAYRIHLIKSALTNPIFLLISESFF